LTLGWGTPTILEMTRSAPGAVGLRVIAALALTLLGACGGTPSQSPLASGNKPVVLIQAPVNGAQVALGSTVAVTGTASDSVGVNLVVLFVDGVSVAETPGGQAQPLAPFSLNWPATVPGAHTLQVFAYRTDGTPSDPAVVQLTVGLTGSGATVSGLPTGGLSPSTVPTVPPAATPRSSRRPRRSEAPTTVPTGIPTIPPTVTPPTPPPLPPTAPPSIPITPPPDGRAPDDTLLEPHLITLADCVVQVCPAGVLAMGSIAEQISAPEGDLKDQLYFVPQANVSYKIELTACSDVSDGTVWKPTLSTDTLVTGCGDWLVLQYGSTASAQSLIDVTYAAVSGQMYNSYVYTVYLLDQ
jgi:hypothetical protein